LSTDQQLFWIIVFCGFVSPQQYVGENTIRSIPSDLVRFAGVYHDLMPQHIIAVPCLKLISALLHFFRSPLTC
jgi:hypothetical protein